jgi:hypothetical protein
MARLTVLLTAILAVGCGASGTQQRVAKMASDQWDCSSSKVHVEQLDNDLYRAVGCRHEATYMCSGGPTGSANECSKLTGS